MSKAIDSMWFNTAQGTFGIILAEDETTGERKLYAGVVSGLDQKADERAILSWGIKVNLGMLGGLLARTKKARTAGFWKWYLRGLIKLPRYLISGWGEYLWGVIIGIGSSIVLTIVISPFCLIFTIPVGATICAHGIWRAEGKRAKIG